MAAGKSTVAEALARRLPRSVHLRGDVFRRMIVGGRAELTAELSDEAWRQLRLRYDLAAATADRYAAAGFTVVLQDVVLGAELPAMVDRIRHRPLAVVVLAPRADVVAARERDRPKQGYGDWPVAELDAGFRADTPRIGLWLDTSAQTPAETVDEILARAWPEGRIG
ncbi:AAA family ATPase [Micromonospora sp. PPF5-17]|uniref:Phosphotransferase n=2 Tax=Micromonosporaceae TaxID=28056 RepID=A0ABX9WAR1_9ACTN|nr:AAA family ATPase [Micromonospora sp. PPF5-17B]NES39702.1 AAA family ATPase [Micromonospora solifontis]NES59140.1 AAA family ATPase [Micromonospora sp. PPF5-6]RNL87087.1 phosphotransferase [Micromonospora solifontis]